MSTLKDFLLQEQITVGSLTGEYVKLAIDSLPAILMTGCVIEFLRHGDWQNLLKKSIIAVILLSIFSPLYKSSVEASFMAADEIYKSASVVTLKDLFNFQDIQGDTTASLFNTFTNAAKQIPIRVLAAFVNLTQFFMLYALKFIFTAVYYLTLSLFPLTILIFVLPSFDTALRGLIYTYLWSVVMPHVVLIFLVIGSDSVMTLQNADADFEKFVYTAALMWAYTALLLFSPLFAFGLIKGTGIADAASKFAIWGSNASISMMTMGLGLASANALPFLKHGFNRVMENGARLSGGMAGSLVSKSGLKVGNYDKQNVDSSSSNNDMNTFF
jgi:hypothetical protein